MKLAFADAYRYVAEPAQHGRDAGADARRRLPGASARRLIDPKRAQDFGAGNPAKGGTIYLTAADEQRHDGQLHPEQLHGLRLGRGRAGLRPVAAEPRPRLHRSTPASPNRRGAGQAAVPHHHPGLPDARTASRVMSFGVMGGNMQPQGHLQTLVRMLDYGQHPQAACDAPRWRFNAGLEINVEAAMDRGHGAGPARRSATASTSSATATRTSAPASSSGAWATRRSKATWPPATRGATGWRRAGKKPTSSPARPARA